VLTLFKLDVSLDSDRQRFCIGLAALAQLHSLHLLQAAPFVDILAVLPAAAHSLTWLRISTLSQLQANTADLLRALQAAMPQLRTVVLMAELEEWAAAARLPTDRWSVELTPQGARSLRAIKWVGLIEPNEHW